MKSKSGFTIVELLIVIVVIGILAAITIVAYNGIQSRGKTAAAQSIANTVVKKVEAYNTIHGQYPTYLELANNRLPGSVTNNSAAQEARLDSSSSVSTGSPTSTNGTTTVLYYTCGTTGAQVVYYNFVTSAGVAVTAGSC